jgi:hypothetical protein
MYLAVTFGAPAVCVPEEGLPVGVDRDFAIGIAGYCAIDVGVGFVSGASLGSVCFGAASKTAA